MQQKCNPHREHQEVGERHPGEIAQEDRWQEQGDKPPLTTLEQRAHQVEDGSYQNGNSKDHAAHYRQLDGRTKYLGGADVDRKPLMGTEHPVSRGGQPPKNRYAEVPRKTSPGPKR